MKLPLFIARRYIISRKSHQVINIISWVSLAGITGGTMALIVVLSVFNGFEHLVKSLLNTFDPDIRIVAREGKVFDPGLMPLEEMRALPGILSFAEVVEENALMRYGSRQHIVTMKGVDAAWMQHSPLDSMLIDGDFLLEEGDLNYTLVGAGVAWYLDLNIRDFLTPVEIYVPRRGQGALISPMEAFKREVVLPAGVFSVQQDFDVRYALLPLRLVRQLLDYGPEVSALEIRLRDEKLLKKTQARLSELAGADFAVQNRMQQQETIYRIMQSERWAIFFILTFIILIAAFNMIGSVSMLVIDKRKDLAVLWSMGADLRLIRRIFLNQGILLSLGGALLGLLLGGLLCWLQQEFGLVSLQGQEGSFVVNAYPVKMRALDFLVVLGTVGFIGLIASWLPTLRLRESSNRRHYLTA